METVVSNIKDRFADDTENFPEYEEEFAYSMGLQAYIFTFPLKIFERERLVRLDPDFKGQVGIAPVARINDIGHMHSVATSDDILPYTPNNDTIYSGGDIELVEEPMIFSMPTILDRYWSVEIANAYMENVFYVGSRATEGKGGDHILVGPDWEGDIPEDLIVHKMEYNSVMFALRIAVKKSNKIQEAIDSQRVRDLQKSFKITSLSNWGKRRKYGKADVPESILPRPTYSEDDPLAYFKLVADLMTENPPTAYHNAQVVPFEYIGLVPGKKFDESSLSDATKKGLARAAAMGLNVLNWKVKYRGTPFTTRWNKLQEGTYHYMYLDRAAGANEGLFVHDYVEAVYYSTYESCLLEDGVPAGGEFFTSSKKYVMTIAKNRLPKVNESLNGFWSFTMYGPDFQLVANEIDRYSLSDQTVEFSEDGSLTIYFQSTDPAHETDLFTTEEEQKRAHKNWLPCPDDAGQLFRVNYRQYLPLFMTRHPRPENRFVPPVTIRE